MAWLTGWWRWRRVAAKTDARAVEEVTLSPGRAFRPRTLRAMGVLSARGLQVLVVLLILFAGAVLLAAETVALLPLTFLLWFGCQWFLFLWRTLGVARDLTLERTINGLADRRPTGWVGRPGSVMVSLGGIRWPGLGLARLSDRLPPLCQAEGQFEIEGWFNTGISPRLEYTLKPTTTGQLVFWGLRVELRDVHGFFHAYIFVRAKMEMLVLPALLDDSDPSAAVKKRNHLPTQGMHRFRRAGAGSELLELRDYLPGDPPRTVAWKVSARRDKLMTKLYESEVPIRCRLFLDVSPSVRVGAPGATPLAQLVGIAAGLARRLLAGRDPVGLYMFGNQAPVIVKPAPGTRHMMRLLGKMAEVAGSPPPSHFCSPSALVEPAWSLCEEVYPDMLARDLNQPLPWWMRLGRWPFPRLSWRLAVAIALALFGFTLLLWQSLFGTLHSALAILTLIVAVCLIPILARGKSVSRKTTAPVSARKQIAAVLARYYQLGAGGIALLTYDDDAFSRYAQPFLQAHQVHYERSWCTDTGEYLYRCQEKIGQAAHLLMQAVAHGRDNELMVVLIDVLELSPYWDPLVNAIKVARSRRHQVVVVLTWPAGVPLPVDQEWPDEQNTVGDPLQRRFVEPMQAIRALDRRRFQSAFRELRNELRRVRVPVIPATANDTIMVLLERIERLRLARGWP